VPAEGITVVPYDPDWPRAFERERVRLARRLAPWLDGGVHHIGSTSIPGMAAKPFIDMLAGVRDLNEARAAYVVLEAEGYEHTPHRPDVAHHFSKGPYGLHLTERDSTLWRERLVFRDVLRRDAALAREYEALKLRLAREAPDIRAYTDAKRAFVHRVLVDAGVDFAWRQSGSYAGSSSARS
jgi:GrpB-like predicted nucleotidyltransferase (UPF0157 family)